MQGWVFRGSFRLTIFGLLLGCEDLYFFNLVRTTPGKSPSKSCLRLLIDPPWKSCCELRPNRCS